MGNVGAAMLRWVWKLVLGSKHFFSVGKASLPQNLVSNLAAVLEVAPCNALFRRRRNSMRSVRADASMLRTQTSTSRAKAHSTVHPRASRADVRRNLDDTEFAAMLRPRRRLAAFPEALKGAGAGGGRRTALEWRSSSTTHTSSAEWRDKMWIADPPETSTAQAHTPRG